MIITETSHYEQNLGVCFIRRGSDLQSLVVKSKIIMIEISKRLKIH